MDEELKALLQQAQQQKKKRQRTTDPPRPPSSSTTPLQRPPTLTLADLAARTYPSTATTGPISHSSSSRTPSTLSDLAAARTGGANTTATTSATTTRLIPFQLRTVKLSSDDIESLLQNRVLKKISSLISFLHGESGASLPDFALVGVLGRKGPRRQSRNGKDYAEWLLDDLEGRSAKILLFGGALMGSQHLPVGAVCLLLQPKPLDSRPGQSAARSLAIYEPSQIVQVGISANFATCGFTDGRGFQCDKIYNRMKAKFCDHHSRPSSRMPKLKAGSAPTFTALSLPTPGRRGQGGTGLIVRPNLIGNRPTPVPKKQAGAAAGSGKKKGLLEKMIKQDQPHRAYRWQPTLVNNNKKPDTGGAAASSADSCGSSSSGGGGGAGGGTSGANRSVIAPVKMEGDRVREVAAILATDEPKRDGAVLVPGPSRIFERGGDAVAYATFKHQQEAARMARETAALHCRQLQQKQSEAKAVQAVKIRKSLGGTLRMAPKPALPASTLSVPGTAPMPAGCGSQQQYQGGMSAEEAEKLMKSKSKHSAEARSELMDHLDGVFEALHEKEARAEQLKALSSIDVTAIYCQECDRYYERHPRLCAEKGHRLRKVPTKKRFFLCGNLGCAGETAVLGLTAPREACERCGEKLWRAKGKGNKAAAGGGDGSKGGGVGSLILSVSESTRNADISSLYVG